MESPRRTRRLQKTSSCFSPPPAWSCRCSAAGRSARSWVSWAPASCSDPTALGALAHEVSWLGALTIDNPQEVAQLAEFGVVFLLFMIGLELSWERLSRMRPVRVRPRNAAGRPVPHRHGERRLFLRPAAGRQPSPSGRPWRSRPPPSSCRSSPSRSGSTPWPAARPFSVLLFQDLAVAPDSGDPDPAGPRRRRRGLAEPADGLRPGRAGRPAAAGRRPPGAAPDRCARSPRPRARSCSSPPACWW